ncbi:phosphotransferase [Paenibacillus sp. sptzw28]|uniref:phosphotransferase enzyme family protein n=1 Tax=Paenibacillus sp. sptzw28 TaxID=715179 RepID=UPI001C6EE709|nr:phosphotransferase [Paenibacillus sp. sptzw28]QYR22814.1 phosphotransferase [Paenibacillus sp. sptzw28]
MEQEVEKLFGESILREAAIRFDLNAGTWRKLGDFENYVYEADRDGKQVILRLTHSSHRTLDEIHAELNWIAYLSSSGLGDQISECLPSRNALTAERIDAGDSYFIACLFRKAPGQRADWKDPAVWNAELFGAWGAVTGRMHRITEGYNQTVGNGIPRRAEWDEDELLIHADRYIPKDEPVVRERLETVMARLRRLPKPVDGYGLIHTDLHEGNFFVDRGRITVFDFDDCAYNWFVHDLAIPMYYAVSRGAPESYGGDRSAFARDFFLAFWQGYAPEYRLAPEWLDALPVFLEMRDLTLYLVLHKKMDVNSLPEGLRVRFDAIRERIVSGNPLVDIDFLSLVNGR